MKCCGKARHKFDQLKETEYIKNEYLIDCTHRLHTYIYIYIYI